MNQLTRRTTLIAAVVAPLLLAVSTASYIAQGDGMNNGEAGGAIQVWSMIAFAIAIVGLARLAEHEAPRAALAVTVVGLAGTAAGVGYGIDSIQAALFGTESIQDTSSAAAPLALQLPGIMFPLSLVLLGVMLSRARIVPASLGYGLAVGAVLFPASRIPDIEAVAVASDLIVLAAMCGIAARLSRGADRTAGAVDVAAV
ncbi:MAG: hypothetical protein AB7L17_15680 [Ilumatobacteraceae bacterium]